MVLLYTFTNILWKIKNVYYDQIYSLWFIDETKDWMVTAVSCIAQWCSGSLLGWTLFIGRNVHCTIITTLNTTWHRWIWVGIDLMKRHGQWFVCLQNSLFSKWNSSVTLTELDQSFSPSCTICLKFILTLFLSNITNMHFLVSLLFSLLLINQ